MKRTISHHLLQALWAILEFSLYIIILTVLVLGFAAIIEGLWPSTGHYDDDLNPYEALFREYIPLFIGATLSLYLTHCLILKRPIYLLGFVREHLLRDFRIGIVMAWIMLALGFLLLVSIRAISIDGTHWDVGLFVGFLFFFLVQSSFEEVVGRSFLIPTIERRSNVWVAVLVSSLIFSWVHGSNPGVTWLGLINIFFAGLLMGLLFVRYRSIWPAIGFHFAWNFLQGSFFGFEVSGHDVYSVFQTREIGNDILTGGNFGFEGSVLSLLALLIACILVYVGNPASFDTLSAYSPSQDLIEDVENPESIEPA